MKGQETPDPELNRAIGEIQEVGCLCHNDFNGNWQLVHMPYSGGYFEQPARLIDQIQLIIGVVNQAIRDNKPKEGNKK